MRLPRKFLPSFFFSAVLWLILNAEFLSLILILVYVGAVMVLFLFISILTVRYEFPGSKILFSLTILPLVIPSYIGALTYVTAFVEKPQGDGGFINGGFFVLSSKVFNLISGDQVNFEKDILKDLADENELVAYEHDGFWRPMDTLRDKTQLEDLWNAGNAPWKIW